MKWCLLSAQLGLAEPRGLVAPRIKFESGSRVALGKIVHLCFIVAGGGGVLVGWVGVTSQCQLSSLVQKLYYRLIHVITITRKIGHL